MFSTFQKFDIWLPTSSLPVHFHLRASTRTKSFSFTLSDKTHSTSWNYGSNICAKKHKTKTEILLSHSFDVTVALFSIFRL